MAFKITFPSQMLFGTFLCAVLACCSKSSLSPESTVFTIIPGEDIQVIDAYFNGNSGQWVNLVIKSTRDFNLPSFSIDYSLSCDNGYKIYDSEYFSLSSNEQDSRLFLVNSGATSCTLTITAIRPQYKENYTDWTGSYPIQIQKQNSSDTSN